MILGDVLQVVRLIFARLIIIFKYLTAHDSARLTRSRFPLINANYSLYIINYIYIRCGLS